MVNNIIDGVIVGKLLGRECFAALGLANPLLLFLGLGGIILCRELPCYVAGLLEWRTNPISLLCMVFVPQIANFLRRNIWYRFGKYN